MHASVDCGYVVDGTTQSGADSRPFRAHSVESGFNSPDPCRLAPVCNCEIAAGPKSFLGLAFCRADTFSAVGV